MLRISVSRALRTLSEAQEQLGPRQFNKAVSRAINESILQGRTEARNAVKAIYNIPQRYVGGINVNKATAQSLTAELFASATPIPMDAFSPRFQTATQSFSITRRGEQRTKAASKRRSNPAMGVSIEVLKGKREIVPFAFMIPGGKPRVFARGAYKSGTSYGFVQRHKRENKKGNDTPVKPLLSVTVHAAVINKESISRIGRRVQAVFPRSIDRNINFLLNRINS